MFEVSAHAIMRHSIRDHRSMTKPFSQSCENNKQYILDIIRDAFAAGDRVLEIGSGTAQHVVHFAQALPDIHWLPSDMPENLATVQQGLADCGLHNVAAPLALDVAQDVWPVSDVDGIFSANTLHIMSAAHVELFFRGVNRVLRPGGRLCVYGPFKYAGEFTTESNARFDDWLKARDARSGVRDFERVDALAQAAGLQLLADRAMPANNQLLAWGKLVSKSN
jgi:cyclopropane fatty-acyl-phospholipid synthase-like methyltransferase